MTAVDVATATLEHRTNCLCLKAAREVRVDPNQDIAGVGVFHAGRDLVAVGRFRPGR